eukprot:TRINITY_DN21748_c0_g1_i2.p1 TRINITY_DN21748_c0_g1~~TRINITY_DN21748_c0_g1_i2.p1  ORF type:complete len:154 (-),score=18.11 TRINITY_DN21748_c0_g1_i2:15-476(-)
MTHVSITSVSGEQLFSGEFQTVSDVIDRIHELKLHHKGENGARLCSIRLLSSEQREVTSNDSLASLPSGDLTAVFTEEWVLADGYWGHRDISQQPTRSLDEALRLAETLKGCKAVARNQSNGDTFFISRRDGESSIRPNGTDQWFWYDRIGKA